MTEDELNRTIAARFVLLREALDLEPAEMAARMGVTLRAYRRWESGQRKRWTGNDIMRLIMKVPVSTDWLFGDDAVPMLRAAR